MNVVEPLQNLLCQRKLDYYIMYPNFLSIGQRKQCIPRSDHQEQSDLGLHCLVFYHFFISMPRQIENYLLSPAEDEGDIVLLSVCQECSV